MTASDFGDFIERYHDALDQIVKGSPEGYKRVYSHRDDVTLANPFGPPARGWEHVADALERAASIYRDGKATGFERIATCITPELAYLLEVERCQPKVGGRDDVSPISVRVTSATGIMIGTSEALSHGHRRS